jgi:hypothetical protein
MAEDLSKVFVDRWIVVDDEKTPFSVRHRYRPNL